MDRRYRFHLSRVIPFSLRSPSRCARAAPLDAPTTSPAIATAHRICSLLTVCGSRVLIAAMARARLREAPGIRQSKRVGLVRLTLPQAGRGVPAEPSRTRVTRLGGDASPHPAPPRWIGENGRAGEIRTHDLLHPMQARYQATLQPEQGGVNKPHAAAGSKSFFRPSPARSPKPLRSPTPQQFPHPAFSGPPPFYPCHPRDP